MSISEHDLAKLSRYIYNISLRMLLDPSDAEDASQEIVCKVLTHYSEFRNESKLETWVYKIAVNYLIDCKRKMKRENEREISFEEFAREHQRVADSSLGTADDPLLEEELKIGCTNAMLQCLEGKNRMIFVLGSVMSLDSSTAAECLGMEASAFRQRLSRIKKKLRNFMSDNCGLLNPDASCSCRRRLPIAIERGRVERDRLVFAHEGSVSISECIETLEELDEISTIYRSQPYYKVPDELIHTLQSILSSKSLGS